MRGMNRVEGLVGSFPRGGSSPLGRIERSARAGLFDVNKAVIELLIGYVTDCGDHWTDA